MRKISMFLIALGILMGYAPVATAQEVAKTEDNVEVYYNLDKDHYPMICKVNQIYYAIRPSDDNSQHAEVMAATPDAPSVLQVPPRICVNGVEYPVEEFTLYFDDNFKLPYRRAFEEIKLPDSVTKMKLYQFVASEEIKVKKINIPKHAEILLPPSPAGIDIDIDDTMLVIPEDHDYYSLKDNFVYDKKDSTRIHCVLGVSGDVRIPEGVKYIGSLFRNSKITTLSLPSTLEEAAPEFAKNVDNLKMIDLSNTKLKEVPDSAFSGARSLQEVKFPAALHQIGFHAFDGTDLRKVTIPNKVTKIEDSAFFGCRQLKKVTLGKNLKIIGNSAFSVSGLKKVVIPNKVTKIEDGAFWGCRQLKKVVLGKKLKTIGTAAFNETAISEITIPKSVTEMQSMSVFSSKNLRKVTFMHRKKLPKFSPKWIRKSNSSGIKFYVKNKKLAKQLRKQLRRKNSKVKKAKIYVGKELVFA